MSSPVLQAQSTPVQLLFALSYDGHALHGTALQPDVPTAAGLVLARVYRHLQPARIWALSVTARLDAGVHAEFNLISMRVALRCAAPSAVRAGLDALEADAHDALFGLVGTMAPKRLSARGLAASKTYRYIVEDGHGAEAASILGQQPGLWRVAPKLNLARMQQAAAVFVGEHDFTAFAASPKRRGQSLAQAVKRLISFEVQASASAAHGGTRWHITCHAAGLLRRQMRFMVAAIVCAGAGLTDASQLHAQLVQAAPPADRAPQAPACGLYLLALQCPGPAAALVAALQARLQTRPQVIGAAR